MNKNFYVNLKWEEVGREKKWKRQHRLSGNKVSDRYEEQI